MTIPNQATEQMTTASSTMRRRGTQSELEVSAPSSDHEELRSAQLDPTKDNPGKW